MDGLVIFLLALIAASRLFPRIPDLIDWPNQSQRGKLIWDLSEAAALAGIALVVWWGWV